MSPSSEKVQYTLGFLGPVSDFYINQFWQQALAAARTEDANLIGFATENVWYNDERKHYNLALYQKTHAGNIDGLLSTDFFRLPHLLSVPGVQIAGEPLDGVPWVETDHAPGTRAAVAHLAGVHRLKCIALALGPDDDLKVAAHYRGYCEGLAEQGIPFDPILVTPHGTYGEANGREAVHILLDERRVTFQAVIASRDDIAIGVMKALQARGLRVPEDVAVIGSHNMPEGRRCLPPLTTSSGPRDEHLGMTGIKLVLAQLRGQPVPAENFLQSELWIRRSCGCFPVSVRLAGGLDADAVPAELAEALIPLEAEELWEAFGEELEHGRAGAFLGALEQLLSQSVRLGRDQLAWHNALSMMRRQALSRLEPSDLSRAESLWQQGRVLVAEMTGVAYAQQTDQREKRQEQLSSISQRLLTTFELEKLLELLPHELPNLGIPGCYVALHEQPSWPPEYDRLILAWDGRGCLLLDPAGRRFPSAELLPADVRPSQRRFDLLAVPLFYREEHLGTVVFEIGPPDATLYLALAQALSSALKVTLLYQAAEEANRLKSRFLATVSHELRTPLNLIVGLSEILLQEPPPSDESPSSLRYRTDVDQIHNSAQHLGRLISDVLDLASNQAGQLKLNCEPLDMAEVLDVVVAAGKQMANEKGLQWEAHIAPNLPKVWGDRTRLRQVGLNLVSNAVKFTERGKVTLAVELEDVKADSLKAGFPAACISISITDTGLGIPPEEQQLIFDEFRQSERSSARGFGGMGLGLAVSRKLVELHGGAIGVFSSGEERAGSIFFVRLPIISQTQLSALSDPSIASAGQMVLILGKDSESGDALRKYLELQGFEAQVQSVDEQMSWLTSVLLNPPGTIVLETGLAAECGVEIMKTLRDHTVTRDLPVLICSVDPHSGSGSVLILDFLEKPMSSHELNLALEKQDLTDKEQNQRVILVVDDEPGTVDMHVRMIQTHWPVAQVLKARNGQEALEIMQVTVPDLVLLDLMMPELDGFRVLEAMRSDKATRNIPVIVLTAQILTEEDMARLNRGVVTVLGKGVFTLNETLARVEAILARNRQLGSESQRLVRKAMAYIHENYTEPLTRTQIARYSSVGDHHLGRCFQKEIGIGPMAYLNRYRITQAKKLLSTSDLPVTEIALAVGFSGSNYFSQVFQRDAGMSPTQYRAGQTSPKN